VGRFAVKPISLAPDFSQVLTGLTVYIRKPLKRLRSRRYDLITALKCGANENLKVTYYPNRGPVTGKPFILAAEKSKSGRGVARKLSQSETNARRT